MKAEETREGRCCGVLHRLGVRVGYAAGAPWGVDVLGAGSGLTGAGAASGNTATSAGLMLSSSAPGARWMGRLRLEDVTASGTLTVAKTGARKAGLVKECRCRDVQGGVKNRSQARSLAPTWRPVLDVLVEPCGVSMFWVLVVALPMLWLPPLGLAAGAGPLLNNGGLCAVWADGLTLFDVTSRLTSSASAREDIGAEAGLIKAGEL